MDCVSVEREQENAVIVSDMTSPFANLVAAERKVYSQNGEDGVIEALFRLIGVRDCFFVEFGVNDATECNTVNLLWQGWKGLMMDREAVSRNLGACVQREHITAENVNHVFAKYRVPLIFDYLSIDIDGNDYWVWKAIKHKPRVVTTEYNAHVSPDLRRTIVYDPDFCWNGSDYFGASLRALAELGDRKGYELVYCETSGTNAFFVARSELPSSYVPRPLTEIYRPPNYFHKGLCCQPDPDLRMIDPDAPLL